MSLALRVTALKKPRVHFKSPRQYTTMLRFLTKEAKTQKKKFRTGKIRTSILVGCFGFNGPLRQYFSLYQAVSQKEGERGKKR